MIRKKVGVRIKELRTSLKITQEELAFEANLDRTYICSVEKGKRNISIVNLSKICSALNINIPEFFNSKLFMENNNE